MSAVRFRPSAGLGWRVGAALTVLTLGFSGVAAAAPADQHPVRATAHVAALDTGRLAFVRGNQIYTSKTDGTNVTRLTSVGKNYRPKWSPNGSRIAYVHQTASGLRDIWVMTKTGADKQQVTHLGDTTEPTWSPHGYWLAFGAAGLPPFSNFLSTPLQKIRSTAPFGSPIPFPTSIDFDVLVSATLDWSPDGKQIAYYSDTYPDSPDHFLLSYHLDTLAVDELSSVGGACCGEGYFGGPAWSPGGRYLAYTELAFDLGQPPPAGPHIAMLAMGAATAPPFPHVVGDSQPAFSPSGRQLVFKHRATIDVAKVDGSGRHVVTTGSQPDWQPVS